MDPPGTGPVKRKQTSHTIAFKIKVLEEVDKKELKQAEICKKFQIAASTLSTFKKNRAKIEEAHWIFNCFYNLIQL